MNELFNLTNKIALVTGGSRGIGKQIVKTYAAQGATVIIASRNINDCQKVAEEVIQAGGNAMAISCDMANLEDIANMYKQIEDEFGKLDILVNNAGVSITKPSIEVTKEDWNTMFDINIRGVFFVC